MEFSPVNPYRSFVYMHHDPYRNLPATDHQRDHPVTTDDFCLNLESTMDVCTSQQE